MPGSEFPLTAFFADDLGNLVSSAGHLSNESKLMDPVNGTEYVSTYEDKDGDWMLLGDVPWK